MKPNRSKTALLAALVLAACGGAGEDSTASSRSAVLLDARNGGAAGFWFLPPIAPEPGDETPNHRGLAPVVEIEELAPGAAGVVAALGEVKDSGAHYQVDWRASESPLSPSLTYRIRVVLSGATLGFADAEVAADGGELRFLFSQETFPLTGERTLPIKFRIAEAAPDGDGDLVPDASDGCPTVPDPAQLDSDEDGIGDACECLGVVCPLSTPCQAAGGCDARTGACLATAEPDGTACDDGDPCTAGDGCVAGACQGGTPLVCQPLDACHLAGVCDPEEGACTVPPAPDGTPCPLVAGTGVCGGGVCLAPPASGSPCGGCGDGSCGACTGTACEPTSGCGTSMSGCGACSGACCGCEPSGPAREVRR